MKKKWLCKIRHPIIHAGSGTQKDRKQQDAFGKTEGVQWRELWQDGERGSIPASEWEWEGSAWAPVGKKTTIRRSHWRIETISGDLF